MITESTKDEKPASCFTEEDYANIKKALAAIGWRLNGGSTNFGGTPDLLAVTLLIEPDIGEDVLGLLGSL
jgi:hypothetical protein